MGGNARKLLARKLRMLRFLRGWSQERLAEESGLHRTYVSLVERAECNISLDNLERIAAAFRLPLAEILSTNAAAWDEVSTQPRGRKRKRKESQGMFIVARRVGDTIRIELDPKVDPRTPIRSLFVEGPIEVLVASVKGDEVRLGISVPMSLVVVRA